MSRLWKITFALFVVAVTNACTVIYEGVGDLGPTLADMEPIDIPPDPPEVPEATLREIEMSYRAALEVARDPDLRHRILVRLADMEMTQSEEEQLASSENREHFNEAISMYDELLQLNETKQDAVTDERLLYRLSKAYALDGKMAESDRVLSQLVQNYPGSQFTIEAEFRRAEQAFRVRDYVLAENLYTRVVNAGPDTPFYLNSIYMQGWSQFKQNNYRGSITPFTSVLDKILIKGGTIDDLSSSEKSLAADTLRVMGFAFSYLDGADTITRFYQSIGLRHYQHLLYSQLGNLYLEKKRYRDAADTYQHYIDNFPESTHGPEFSVSMIEVYKQGNFPSMILPSKENFVKNYGVYSRYWSGHNEKQRDKVRPHLKTFLDELSSYYHAEGQALVAAANSPGNQKKADKPGGKNKLAPPEPAFIKAANYYREIVDTFPDGESVPETTFLMAEALRSGKLLPEAVDAYEKVAFNFIDGKRGADSGYASILVLQQLIDNAQVEENREKWKARRIQNSINFADYFPGDKRATAVLTKAAEHLFESGDKAQAIIVAKRITEWNPPATVELQKTAWLVLAHSQFDLEQYDAAELAYRKVLTMLSAKDSLRPQIIERIAASMFKRAEAFVVADKKSDAVELLLQIEGVSPGSEIAQNAQYDAGNYLMELKEWSRSEKVFVDFAARFPKHKLASTITPKLAVIYQELQLWDKAAAQLAIMSQSNQDPETRRSSLYLSAELYRKSKRLQKAIDHYKSYIKQYPAPFDLAVEARFQLVEIYGEVNNGKSRDYWLRELIKADAKAGSDRTQRSTYLAAFASNKFAGDTHARFDRIKLTLPIKKSLKAKRKALDETLAAYKQVIDYGVAEFATAANHHIGEVYSQLHDDLLNSERPKGLDELAMEQYEILLEEQSYPFKQKAISMLTVNAERAWEGFYDEWVKKSFSELAKLLPARYGKSETELVVSEGVY